MQGHQQGLCISKSSFLETTTNRAVIEIRSINKSTITIKNVLNENSMQNNGSSCSLKHERVFPLKLNKVVWFKFFSLEHLQASIPVTDAILKLI